MAIVLYINLSYNGYYTFLRFTPFLSGLGLGLLASGYQGLKQTGTRHALTYCPATRFGR